MIATSHLVISCSCKMRSLVFPILMAVLHERFRRQLATVFLEEAIRLLRRKLLELLPQLLPRIFKRGGVVSPVPPARGNGHDDGVHERHLPQIVHDLGVFVILNAVADGLQPYAWRRFL